jgi:hypothetical protein
MTVEERIGVLPRLVGEIVRAVRMLHHKIIRRSQQLVHRPRRGHIRSTLCHLKLSSLRGALRKQARGASAAIISWKSKGMSVSLS